uniref:non-specific serine/threonine protein kinase n=1 Tax=Macrostomum lignano TaxID=282301 RepID=A0A1I8J9R7_9PLAT
MEGDEQVSFDCEVNDKDAEVFWYFCSDPEADLNDLSKMQLLEEEESKYKMEILQRIKRKLTVYNLELEHDGVIIARTAKNTSVGRLEVQPDVEFCKKLYDTKGIEWRTKELMVALRNPRQHPVVWLKDGQPIASTDRIEITNVRDDHYLIFHKLELSDAGEYTAKAGRHNCKCRMSVYECEKPPGLKGKMHEIVKIRRGEKFSASLPLKGFPIPNVVLLRNGEPVPESVSLKAVSKPGEVELVLDSATGAKRSDRGKYQLKLFNSAGEEYVPFEFEVLDRPGVPGEPLDVLDLTQDSCTLMWDPPEDDGGSPITSYDVEVLDVATGEWKPFKSVDVEECKITGLIQWSKYKFRVRAVNSEGHSDWLETVKETVARDPWDPPDPPGPCKLVDWDRTFADIEWTAPKNDNGSPVSKYIVESRSKMNPSWASVTEVGGKDLKVRVQGLTELNEYEFRIVAANKAGNSEPSIPAGPMIAKPRLLQPRIERVGLKPVQIKAGSALQIEIKFVGEPPPDTAWTMRGGKALATEAKVQSGEGYSNMTISEALRKHAGIYHFTVSNQVGSDSVDVEVVVLAKPTSPEAPLEVADVTKSSCKLSWRPPADDGGCPIKNYIVQKYDSQRMQWETVSNSVSETTLAITKLKESHEYQFRVLAETAMGTSEPLSTAIPVKIKNPFDEPEAPAAPEIADHDRNVIKLCYKPPEFDGGAPILGYQIERKEVRGSRWVNVNKDLVQSLEFSDDTVREGKEYEYRLIAVNEAGPSEPSEASKKVKAKPSKAPPKLFTEYLGLGPNGEIRVKAGDILDVKIPCEGAPKPVVSWWKDSGSISADAKSFEGEDVIGIEIHSAKKSDSGHYKVSLTNTFGSAEATVKVIVMDKPDPPEGPLLVKDMRAESCKLEWKPPKNTGGCEITDFIVEFCDEDSRTWEKVLGSSSETTCPVKNLKEGRRYRFRVSAVNRFGVSEPLETSAPVVAKNPFDVPGAPEALSIASYDRFHVALTWKPPKVDGGNPVNGYFVEKQSRGGEWEKVTPLFPTTERLSFSVSHLIEGREYQFRVSAVNEAGPGLSSQATSPLTIRDPVFPAGPPGELNVDKQKRAGVQLSWTKPKTDGGGKVLEYTIEKKNPDGEWVPVKTVPTNERSVFVPMREGEEAQFRVFATNEAGPGESTRPTLLTKAENKPEKPHLDLSKLRDIVIKAGEDLIINVPYRGYPKPAVQLEKNGLFFEPNSLGKLNINEFTDGDSGDVMFFVSAATRKNSGEYQITLENEIGKDSGLLRVTVLDKPGPCAGPIIVKDVDSNQATLQWEPPIDDGGEPVTNYVVEKRLIGSTDWISVNSFVALTNATVRNLEEGQSYEFRVMAENCFGRGAPLETTSPVVAKPPYDPPSACDQPTVDAVSADSVSLSWHPPKKSGGAPVSGYIVEKRLKGDKNWTKASVAPVPATDFTVRNLPEGKEFEFRVTPVNKAGPGATSPPTNLVKVSATLTAPRILTDFATKEVVAPIGREFKIKIPYHGSPPEEIDCSNGGSLVAMERFEVLQETSEVVIVCRRASKTDHGRYTVTLKNKAGKDAVDTKVSIVDRPGKPEGPLRTSKIGLDSCTLTWNPPQETSGIPIDNYIVEKQDSKTGEWKPLSKFVRRTEYEAFGLEEGKPVKFRVRAENQYGVSEPLELETSVVPQPECSRPGEPDDVEVKEVDEASVTIGWKKPTTDGGGRIQGYIVEYKESNASKWKKANDFVTKDTKFSVANLEKNTKYEFRVRAKNEAGLSEPSPVTKPVETKSKVKLPGNPGTPSVAKTGKNYAELEWTKPLNEGGSRLLGFKVEKRRINGDWKPVLTLPGSATDALVDGLDENGEYEFRVTAVNAAGEGDPSPASLPTRVVDKLSGIAPEFLTRLQSAGGPVGGAAAFSCRIDGKPPPQVRWFRNGIELRPSSSVHMTNDGDLISVEFSNLTESDAGEITCELSNKVGKEVTSARLSVQKPPRVDKVVPDQVGDTGELVKFKVFFSGNGPMRLLLKRGSTNLTDSPNVKLQEFDDYILVQLKDLHREDSGDYRLEISNDSGSTSVPFNLKVRAKPGIITGPLEVADVTKNSCKLTWKPPKDDGGSKITHYVVERQEVGKDNWIPVTSHCKDTQVDVQGLLENSEYNFRVYAVNENGASEPLTTLASIIAKMPFDNPKCPGSPEVEEVGEDFVSISWSRPISDGGGRITGYYVDKREAGTDNWTRVNFAPVQTTILNVANLIEGKDYEFRVFAENEAGLSSASQTSRKVTVRDPDAQVLPEFVSQLNRLQVKEGKKAEFQVELKGTTPFQVAWYKGVRELNPTGHYDIGRDGNKYFLVVNSCCIEDSDEYSIRVTNRAGSRASRAALSVQSEPKIKKPARFDAPTVMDKGDSLTIKLPHTGCPKPTAEWKLNGKVLKPGSQKYDIELKERHCLLTINDLSRSDAGVYTLDLQNDLGTASATIEVKVNDRPEPPRNLRVESITDINIVLSWQPAVDPIESGVYISGYFVEKRELPNGNWVRCGQSRFCQASIDCLVKDKQYEFRVVAENLYGRSDPSVASGPHKLAEPPAPVRRSGGEGKLVDGLKRRNNGILKPDNYDKCYNNLWDCHRPHPVTIKSGSVYDSYEILEELGSGAFGVVYRCKEIATGQIFVAKFIDTPLAIDKLTVRNEVNIMNMLHHPKLINLHDVYDDVKEMVLIMEFLSGGEVFDRIADNTYKMSEAEVVNYIRQVCEGLKHMHEQGVVHLDIKPENLICETSKSANIKIIDFGLATKLSPDEPAKVTTATAEFAAPEIAENEPVGFYTDMWAVGVLAYVLLSGLSPFAGNDDCDTLNNVKRCDWDFGKDAFNNRKPEKRLTVHAALDHPWLLSKQDGMDKRIPPSRYEKFRQRMQDLHPNWFGNLGIARLADFGSLKKLRMKDYSIHETTFDRKEAAPRFVMRSRNAYCVEGQNAVFECKVLSVSPPLVSWFRGDEALAQSLKYMQRYAGNDFSLKVNRVKKCDAGEYRVRAENSFGSREVTIQLHVEPIANRETMEPPEIPFISRKKKSPTPLLELWREPDRPARITFPLRNRFIQEGGFVKLSCTFDGFPAPNVVWLKDGAELSAKSKTDCILKIDSGVTSLEFYSSTVQDSGSYTVRVENAKGADETTCKLDVYGGRTRLNSVGAGRAFSVTRQKDSFSVDRFTTESFSTMSRTKKMSTINGGIIHEERYYLETHRTGSKLSNAKILAVPKCTKPLAPNVQVTEGENVQMGCEFEGEELEINWDLNRVNIRPEGTTQIKTINGTSNITLFEAVLRDSGLYTCAATNSSGTEKTSCSLHVAEKPKTTVNNNHHQAPVRIQEHPRSIIVNDGDPFELIVRLESGDPGLCARWTLDGSPVSDDFEIVSDPSAGVFRLKSPEALYPDDSGNYRVELLPETGLATQCTVCVRPPPEEEAEDKLGSHRLFESFPNSVTIDEGESVVVSCRTKQPIKEATWFKDGSQLLPTEDDRISVMCIGECDLNLSIRVGLSTDSGFYELRVVATSGMTGLAAFSLQILPGEELNHSELASILESHLN